MNAPYRAAIVIYSTKMSGQRIQGTWFQGLHSDRHGVVPDALVDLPKLARSELPAQLQGAPWNLPLSDVDAPGAGRHLGGVRGAGHQNDNTKKI